MVSPREMIGMNMEELCTKAIDEQWDWQALEAWSVFKIAQYVEMIAYGKKGNE